jgi:hypothetical protein
MNLNGLHVELADLGRVVAVEHDVSSPALTVFGHASYSNAGDKPWQMVVLGGTQRIRTAISERDAAIC